MSPAARCVTCNGGCHASLCFKGHCQCLPSAMGAPSRAVPHNHYMVFESVYMGTGKSIAKWECNCFRKGAMEMCDMCTFRIHALSSASSKLSNACMCTRRSKCGGRWPRPSLHKIPCKSIVFPTISSRTHPHHQ